jgi:hypothetical protein
MLPTGARLEDDDDGLFSGGTQTLYVELTPDSTIDEEALERLLLASIHLH